MQNLVILGSTGSIGTSCVGWARFCAHADFTTGSFEDRIRGAKDDPTFLMAPVHPVRSYDAINLNANKFESLMHRFFSEARLDIEIMDRFGKPFRPREWLLLLLPVIETAIAMLLDGTILRHRYDAVACEIVSVQAHD